MGLYRPTFLKPQNISIDMSQDYDFTAQVNGTTITSYRLRIFRIDNNALLHDTGTIALLTPLYDRDILQHTVVADTITYKGALKWILTASNSSTSADSAETPFWNWSTPSYTMIVPPTIGEKEYEFVATYSQAQGVNISKFKFIWYDSSDNILADSDWIYSANTKYTFDGFLNGQTYSVESIVETEYNVQVSTGKHVFDIDYDEPSFIIVPDANVNNKDSSVQIDWAGAVQIPGDVTGTYDYVEDFLVDGNWGLHLHDSSSISWDVAIPMNFTATFIIQLPVGFTGVFCKLGDEYEVGYTGDRFFFKHNGTEEYGLPFPITINPFIIAIRPTDVYVRYLDVFNTWNDIKHKTWTQLTSETWKSVKYK